MIGKHILAEFYGCSGEDLDNLKLIETSMIDAANKSGATILNVSTKTFEPQGLTVVITLAESHFSLHSYPEYNYAAIDAFTCGEVADPEIAIQYLVDILKPQEIEIQRIDRINLTKASKYISSAKVN